MNTDSKKKTKNLGTIFLAVGCSILLWRMSGSTSAINFGDFGPVDFVIVVGCIQLLLGIGSIRRASWVRILLLFQYKIFIFSSIVALFATLYFALFMRGEMGAGIVLAIYSGVASGLFLTVGLLSKAGSRLELRATSSKKALWIDAALIVLVIGMTFKVFEKVGTEREKELIGQIDRQLLARPVAHTKFANFVGEGSIIGLAYSRDGKTIATVGQTNFSVILKIWDAVKGTQLSTTNYSGDPYLEKPSQPPMLKKVFGRDSSEPRYHWGSDKLVIEMPAEDGIPKRSFEVPISGPRKKVKISRTGKFVVVMTITEQQPRLVTLEIWDADSGKIQTLKRKFQAFNPTGSAQFSGFVSTAFSRDETLMAIGLPSGRIEVFDLRSKKSTVLSLEVGKTENAAQVEFAGKYLIATSLKKLKVWTLPNLKQFKAIESEFDIYFLTASAHSNKFVVAGTSSVSTASISPLNWDRKFVSENTPSLKKFMLEQCRRYSSPCLVH